MISYRQSQQIQEHKENVGNPNVFIEPQFKVLIQKAVDEINKKNPQILKNVSDIIGHLDKSVFGEYSSKTGSTIYVNIQKIQDEVKKQMAGRSQQEIENEISRQIQKTVLHEATHMTEYQQHKDTTEFKAEEAEKLIP